MSKLKGTAAMMKKPLAHLAVITAWDQDPRPALCLWVTGQKKNTGQSVTDDFADCTCPDCKIVRAEGMALYEKSLLADKKTAKKEKK